MPRLPETADHAARLKRRAMRREFGESGAKVGRSAPVSFLPHFFNAWLAPQFSQHLIVRVPIVTSVVSLAIAVSSFVAATRAP